MRACSRARRKEERVVLDLEELRGALCSALMDVLEEAAFVFSSPVPDSDLPVPERERVVRAMLPFTGERAGTFFLTAPLGLGKVLVREMTGEPENIAGSDQVLGEILNMAAGLTLGTTGLAGERWELGIPVVESLFPTDEKGLVEPDVRVLLLTEEGDRIEAGLFWRGRGK